MQNIRLCHVQRQETSSVLINTPRQPANRRPHTPLELQQILSSLPENCPPRYSKMDSDLSSLPTDQCIIPGEEDTPLCTVIHHPSVEEFNHEVIVHPDVGQYGYLWHPGLRMLVCLHCKTMVAPHRLRYHCNQAKHQAPDAAVVKTILALVDLRYKKYLPNVTSGQKLRPIKGLDTEDSRQCTVCP
jgi:hypothetical protein